jgi:hypothetical protein
MKRYPAVSLQVRQMSQEEQEESDALPVKFLLGQDSIDNCNEGRVITRTRGFSRIVPCT